MTTSSTLQWALKNPAVALEIMNKEDCERSLAFFIKDMWVELEPTRTLKWEPHLDVICRHLEACERADVKRLIINIPPGFMKSLIMVFFTAWVWGPKNRPDTRWLSFSYSASLSTRDNRKVKTLIMSEKFRRRWGDRVTLSSDESNKVKFELTGTGFSLATSVGGVGTGERGDFIKIDDPISAKDSNSPATRASTGSWFLETIPTRTTDPENTVIILIMQRLHSDDPSGIALSKDLGYEHLMLPMSFEPERCSYTSVPVPGQSPVDMRYVSSKQMWLPDNWKPTKDSDHELIPEFKSAKTMEVYKQDWRTEEGELLAPDRFPPHVVARDSIPLGSYGVAGQFQQRPSPRGGLLFQREWFVRRVAPPPIGTRWVRHWDLAATKERIFRAGGARTAGVLLGRMPNKKWLIADCKTAMKEGAERDRLINEVGHDDKRQYGRVSLSLPQDPGQAGKIQAAEFRNKFAAHRVKTQIEQKSGDKVARADPISAQAEAGNVEYMEGPWNTEFFDEVTTFPTGKRKDIVDALSGAYNALISQGGEVVAGATKGQT